MRDGLMRVALVVGDTAGHTHPALALAEAMHAMSDHARVFCVGTADSVAATLIERAHLPYIVVPGSPIRGADLAGLARAGRRTMQSIGVARAALVDHQIQLVVGFGGFASGGVMLAARTLGLPTAIFEANVEFGLANRWLRPWVGHVFLGLGRSSGSAIGVPVRASVSAMITETREAPRGALRVLVASGSRGADFFDSRLPAALGAVAAMGIPVEVHQQSSTPDVVQRRYDEHGVAARVEPFIDDIAGAYRWADVAITRGGANTIAELACAALPALLVPLADASANHQAANARLWQETGAGAALEESDWQSDTVVSWLRQMATDPITWSKHSAAARGLARPSAAQELATACAHLIGWR